MFVDTLITASPEFFTGRSQREVQAYFTEAAAFGGEEGGPREYLFRRGTHGRENAPPPPVLHPHHGGRAAVRQGDFGQPGAAFPVARRVSRPHEKGVPVLKRGESALVTKRKHIPTWLFKQSVDLTRQQQAIEKAVSEIGVLERREEAGRDFEMVGPYFSRLEKHLGQMKKYQATIDYLMQENEGLKEKVNSEKSIQKQMEVLMLKKENEQLRRFVQRIPPEVRQALKEQQQGQRRSKDRQR